MVIWIGGGGGVGGAVGRAAKLLTGVCASVGAVGGICGGLQRISLAVYLAIRAASGGAFYGLARQSITPKQIVLSVETINRPTKPWRSPSLDARLVP